MRKALSFFGLAAVVCLGAWRSVANFAAVMDADIWLRLRTGEWIAQNHAFPHSGIFTQHTELPWIAYSWGFDLLTWFAYHCFGSNGLANLTILLIVLQAAVATTLFVGLAKTARSVELAVVLTGIAVYACNITAPRSLLFSVLFFTVQMNMLLASARDGESKRLWVLPAIYVVWANMHIQFVYGLFVVGLYAVAATINAAWSMRRDEGVQKSSLVRPWGLLLACMAATCVGPYFVSVYGTIFSYAGNTAQYEQVLEYAAMSFRRPEHYVVLTLVLAAFMAMGRRGFDAFRVLLLASTALVAFRAQRDAWFVCIPAAFLLAEMWREEFAKLSQSVENRFAAFTAGAVVAALATTIGFAAYMGLDRATLMTATAREYPVGAVEFIARHHPPGPLYNTYNWGEYLVFHLRDYPVSIDGRTDVFGPAMTTRAMATVNAYDLEHDEDFQRARLVLLERFLPLTARLAQDPRYRLIYADNLAAVFEKVSP